MTSAGESGSGPSQVPTRAGPEAPPTAGVAASLTRPLEAVERLRVLETLSYGVLYEGRVFQASRSEPISLLKLDRAFEQDPEVFARLVAQLLATSRLLGPSILSPRGVFRQAKSLYLLFDPWPGLSLATGFDFLERGGLRLSSEALLRVAGGVLAALDHATGRDSDEEDVEAPHGLLTPENVFLGEGQRVLVRGFGIWPAGIDRTGLLGPGERCYLAPGQNHGAAASPRADLLSLGTILFEAVSGFPAFDAPPEEEDFTELRASVEELKEKAEPSLRDLYDVILACLSPPASVTRSYRGRVRKAIDTLFVREFSRDRVAKTLSLEELAGRVKPRRPAIVRATHLSLVPAEAEPVSPSAVERVEPPVNSLAEPSRSAAPVEPSRLAAEASQPQPPARPVAASGLRTSRRGGWRISGTVWAFLGAVAAIGALLMIFWSSWPRAERVESERPTCVAEEPVAVTYQPGVAAVPTTPETVASPSPAAAPAREPKRPASREASSAQPRRVPAVKQPTRRRISPERSNEAQSEPVAAQNTFVPAGPEPTAAVVPGALVSLGVPGLVLPVLVQAPATLRYGESDPRPAVERLILLEILVSDSGRVRGSRILRADRLPPGFAGRAEQYLAALRFRPAELRGVPVKVWMPFEVRFLAP